MENNKFELETLNLRNVFLQDKISELRDENFLLHSQISSLKDEIFILKKTISHMNETLNHQNALKISSPLNDNRFENSPFNQNQGNKFMKRLTTFMMLQTNLNNTSKDLLYLNGVEIRKSERYIKKNEKHINTMPINIGDIDPEPYDLKNSEFYDLEKNNNNMENLIKDLTTILPEKQIETFLTNILENTELFYKYNDMISYKHDSPLVREEISNAEKKIDQYEIIFQSIINSIQEMNKSSLIYFKGINGFLNEVDKLNKLLNKNHELLILVSIIVEIVQGFKLQLEKIINTINNGISEPLIKFVNSEFNKKKHLKKIYDESLNDYEKKQLKILEFKKKKILKDPSIHQSLFKNYLSSLQLFETSKNNYLCALNTINFEINVQLSDKLCLLSLLFGQFYENGNDYIHPVERILQLYTKNLPKKEIINEYILVSLETSKKEIENFIRTYTLNSNIKLMEKEGYLHKKKNNSNIFKKQYYRVQNGVLSRIKLLKTGKIQIKEISSLETLNIKEFPVCEYPYSFEIACPKLKKPMVLMTDCQKLHQEWVNVFKNSIEFCLSKNSNPLINIFNNENQPINSKLVLEGKEKQINLILKKNKCADCNAFEPCWISINCIVLICLECSGIHRKMGPSISKIRSLKLDNINNELIEIFYDYNMVSINQIWEAKINYNQIKPEKESTYQIKEKWIRKKYIDKEFIDKNFDEEKLKEKLIEGILEKNISKALFSIVSGKIDLNKPFIYDYKETTYLHLATLYSNTCILELLIQNGANINNSNHDNLKPMEFAKQIDKQDLVDYFNTKI